MSSLPKKNEIRSLILLWVCMLIQLFEVKTQCPSLSGVDIDWWIIFQRKDMPFFHFYVDSSNNKNISVIEPEKPDSVLSKAMLQIAEDQTFPQYMVYSSDFLNVKELAKDLEFPSYGKWMHGIVAADSSTTKGFWMIHNNLFFPPMFNGTLILPDDELWRYTTVGDTLTDIFYICLSMNDADNLENAMVSIMASNPFIHLRSNTFQPYDYFKDVYAKDSPMAQESAALTFTDCFYSLDNSTEKHCLYKYTAKSQSKIMVYTRPRGMVKTGHGFCYNSGSNLQEFVSLTDSPPSNTIPDNSVFAITNDRMSPMKGVTCFGQDIAGYGQVVGVMICTQIPGLWLQMLSSRISSWGCSKRGSKSRNPSILNDVHRGSIGVSLDFTGSEPDQGTGNSECESCARLDDDDIEDGLNWKFTSVLENKYKGDIDFGGIEMLKDFSQIKHSVPKIPEVKKPEPQVIEVDKSLEMPKYLLENEKEVLAMFCRKGCQFCRKHEILLPEMRRLIPEENIDILYVNIEKVNLPEFLQVSWTPTFRFKPAGTNSNWINFEEIVVSFETLMEFLKTSRTRLRDKREKVEFDVTQEDI